jgi:hypothetical protein
MIAHRIEIELLEEPLFSIKETPERFALDVDALVELFPDPNDGCAAGAHVCLIDAYDEVIEMFEG